MIYFIIYKSGETFKDIATLTITVVQWCVLFLRGQVKML